MPPSVRRQFHCQHQAGRADSQPRSPGSGAAFREQGHSLLCVLKGCRLAPQGHALGTHSHVMPHKKPGHSSSSHVPNAGRTLSALCPTFKAARSFPAATASDTRPEELRAQAGPGADPPGSWLRASWRDGVAGGWPGPGYRAAGSGPGGSGKPSAQPEGPQPGPSSAGPRAGGTGNTGPLAGTASGPSGSNSGAAWRQSKSRSEVTSARCFCRTSFLR